MPPKKKTESARREAPTIREVAKLAGVGLMTVSRVLNDPGTVRLGKRKKVLAAISELGYERNEAASALRGQKAMMMIGLIVPDLSDVFFAICANTIERLARASGYQTLIVSSGHDVELEMQQAEIMARRKFSGLLLVTSGKADPQRVNEIISNGLQIVAFDRPLEGVAADAVLVENRSGAEEAVEHLIGHGHKKIACAGYDAEAHPVRERLRGYRNAMLSNGLIPEQLTKIESLDAANEWIKELRSNSDSPTAIFSTSYRASVFLLRALSEHRVKVPSEMAFIGFDDFELAPAVNPPTTTVGQSPSELAKQAFRLLLDRVQNPADGKESSPQRVMLQATLLIRESCGPHTL